MLVDHFPVLGLILATPRLQLRLPTPDELGQLADLAAEGVHDPREMPFVTPWTEQPPADVARSVVQNHWATLGAWEPTQWSLNLTVFRDGIVVGSQSVRATDFGVARETSSGSWLGLEHHGQGIGTEMRAAILHLAFAGLGAVAATSAALETNPASHAVSRKLGYEADGTQRRAIRGVATVDHRFRLSRERWEQFRTVPVDITGLEPCLPLFGV